MWHAILKCVVCICFGVQKFGSKNHAPWSWKNSKPPQRWTSKTALMALFSIWKWNDHWKKKDTKYPGTQMSLVLIGKGLVLGGWPSKIEVIWVPGISIYLDIASLWCLVFTGLSFILCISWIYDSSIRMEKVNQTNYPTNGGIWCWWIPWYHS